MSKLNCIKVSDKRYVVASTEYDIVKSNDTFYIRKNKVPVKWNTGFKDIRAAINFMEGHNYITATVDEIEWSPDDLEYVIEAYHFKKARTSDSLWIAKLDDIKFMLQVNTQDILLTVESDGRSNIESFRTFDDLIGYLDGYYKEDDIFASMFLVNGEGTRQVVKAASKRRTSRELAQDLVRVRSSNLWSYGFNIKNAKDKTGDLIIQFKGKDGGPTGGIYQYFDVPLRLWHKFLNATSKGHFFWENIRNNFWYRKLTGNKKGVLRNALN